MNHIVLIGRLTRDPELRYTPNGVAVANFDLAVDRPTSNQQGERQTDFIRIVVWQKQAELCANYLKKGRLVGIEGRLQIRNYETQDGQKRRVAEVVANFVQFLDRNREENQNVDNTLNVNSDDDLGGINLDDLPF
ncbi:MAG TPA: single-stranded DNA-binding protein [Bacillota bacterium]